MPAIKDLAAGLSWLAINSTCWTTEAQSVQTQTSAPPEVSLEELLKMEVPVVEAASKYKQKITEAPSSVTIITSDEVKKYGYRTLADILQSAPGLYVSYDRNYSVLGIRGFRQGEFNNRVLLLVDGHRLNNGLSDSAAIGTEFIVDVDLIDRVEIIRGPGSSLYGNNAFFGVINVITRKGRDMAGHGAEVSGAAASFDTYKGRVTYGNRFKNGLEMLLSGTLYDSEGHDRLYYPEFDQRLHTNNFLARGHNGIAANADGDYSKSAFGSLGFRDFSVQGAFITREKVNPTAPELIDFNDARLRTTDERSYVNLKYAREFSEIVDLQAQLYYDRYDFTRGEPSAGILYKRTLEGEWWGTEVQLVKRIWERHTLTFGGEYRDDFRQEQQVVNTQTGGLSQQVNTNRQNYGVYFQGDFAVVTNLHFNGGVRYDQYGDFDATVNPRLALIYNPFGQSVLKFIYSTAFRAPNFEELYFDPRVAASIRPETITTYELVYEQGIGKHLRSSVAGFYNEIEDFIRFNSAAGHQKYENLKSADAKGVELALEGFWLGGLRGRASYTFQQTEDNSGRVLTDSPRHLAKLDLSVPLVKEKVFAGLEFQYASRRTATFITPAGTEMTGADAPGYGIVNLTLFSQNLVKGLDVSASIYNLLDKKYFDPSTPFHQQDLIAQDGRIFRVKVTYRF